MKNNMEYTKGEWKVNGFDKRLVQVDLYDGVNRFGIADCSNTGLLPEQEIANAQLISAAPEMYEALKVVYELLKMQYSIVLGHYPNYDKYTEIEQVEKALAKAEGR